MLLYKIRLFILGYSMHGIGWILRLHLPPKISVTSFIEKDGKYLVLDLSYRKGFAFPGGLLEGNETLEEALAREVFEETGLTVTSSKYITSKKAIQYRFPVLVAAYAATTTGELTASKEGSLHFKTKEEILAHCAYQNSKEAFLEYLALQSERYYE